MALVGRQNACSSLSSQFPHVIFLSFRGPDTGKTFTDHLYTALTSAGLSTFRDIDALDRGEDIKSQLQEAIMRCRIAIIIISKGYADSSWCLDELTLILQCRRTTALTVLPIFYDVDPSTVRYIRKSFYKAFVRHEKRIMSETDDRKREWLMNTMAGYKKAVIEVANLSGMVLKNEADGYESKLVQKVVSLIDNKLNCMNFKDFHVEPYLVGVDTRAEQINFLLRDVDFVSISGVGGIGKTTIARRVFNMNYTRFKYSSFLANVSQVLREPNGLSKLQRQLHSDVLKEKTKEMDSVLDGINEIKSALSLGRVLVVFDDVNQEDFEVLNQMRDWFCPGSKIIITTRSRQRIHQSCVTYYAQEMNLVESLELFSWHAFRSRHPPEEYLDLSNKFLVCCRGSPLALQVMGASLRGQTLDVWENMFRQSTGTPLYSFDEVLRFDELLKISFDSLSYHSKSVFLDIACFFCGMYETEAIMILDAHYGSATVRIKELQDIGLLTVDHQYNTIRMHQLIQDMGREIIRLESPMELGKRSRLWQYKDSSQILRGDAGTKYIEGLALNNNRQEHFPEPSKIKKKDKGRFSFSTKAFLRMKRLRLLEINYAQLTGDYKDFPENLHWLSWHGSPLTSLTSLSLDNLISLNMKHSNLKKLWTGNKDLGSLKILNLSHSHHLVKISGLSKVRALEKMVLKGCTSLVEIDESIGFAEGLTFLDLRDCKSLKKLPNSIARLKSLKILTSGCSNLNMSTTESDQLIPPKSNNVPPKTYTSLALKFLTSACSKLNMSTTKSDQLIPLKSNNVPPKTYMLARYDQSLPVMEHTDMAENAVRNKVAPILRDHPMAANSTFDVGSSSSAVPVLEPGPTDEASTAEKPDPKGKCAITIADLNHAKGQCSTIRVAVALGNQQQDMIASDEEMTRRLQEQINADIIPVIEATPTSLPFTNDELAQDLAAEKELYEPATTAFNPPFGTTSSRVIENTRHPIEWEGCRITQKARPILEQVKAMHPDFISGFVVKHGPYQLMLLEELANLLTIVRSTKVKDLTPHLLENVTEKMNDMIALGIDLKFLKNRLNDISECSNLAALELGLIEEDLAIAKLEESVVQLKQQVVRLQEEIKTRRRTRAVNAEVILQLKGELGAWILK